MSRARQRIAMVCSDPGIGPDQAKGASVHFRSMARALDRQGVEVLRFMARAGTSSPADRLQIVPRERRKGAADELVSLAHGEVMAAAIRAAGPFDAVYERLSLFGCAGLAVARELHLPLLVEVNAPLWEEAARYRTLHLRHTARALALDILAAAHAVLAVSGPMARRLAAEGVDRDKIHVVGNGVDGDLFAAAQPVPVPAPLRGHPVLVFVGSLKPWHGIDFLLEAHARLQSVRPVGLWIVGDGPLGDRVASAARSLPNGVYWSGAVDHEEIPGILKACDGLVAPYPADAPDYFCPMKVIEAAAAGCPVLASRTACVREALQHSHRHELFATASIDSFIEAVIRLLDRPTATEEPSLPEEITWDWQARRVLSLLRTDAVRSTEVQRT